MRVLKTYLTKLFLLYLHLATVSDRFYFFNTETKTNAWALHPSLIGRAPAAVQDAPETAKPSDPDLPCIAEVIYPRVIIHILTFPG